jgi:DNA-binding NarL/FixJ family response regulator
MITAILFEDDKNFRESIKLLFEHSEHIKLLAAFPNAENASKKVRELCADIILMDIEMPGTNGIEAVNSITNQNAQQKVMMLTNFENEHKIFAAICAGASGYSLKGDIEKLEQGIIDVYNGGGHFSAPIAMRVMKMLQNPIVTKQTNYVSLTPREREVLQKMVEGGNRKMVASELRLSPETINDYYKAIYQKLHVNSAQEAVREAILRKLV